MVEGFYIFVSATNEIQVLKNQMSKSEATSKTLENPIDPIPGKTPKSISEKP
jgi:hypothetical protein